MSKTLPLTTRHLMTAFAVGHMTIFNWRHGTPTKDALPSEVDESGGVSFKRHEVLKWANKNGVEIKKPAALDAIDESKLVPRTKHAEVVKKPKRAHKAATRSKPVAKPKAKKIEATPKPRKVRTRTKKASAPTTPPSEAQPAQAPV